MNDRDEKTSKKRRRRFILIAIIAIIVYAIAVRVTNINLEEPLEPRRQENLVGLLRELARPDLFTFEGETRSTNVSIRMPCPDEIRGSQVSIEGRQVLLSPNCVNTTQDLLTMTGTGFSENANGVVLWLPIGATTARRVTDIRVDEQGNFTSEFTMPDVRPTEEPQQLEVVEVVSRQISGTSDITNETFTSIIQTILMALVASTIGTVLAVPISFLGARNLMHDITSPLASIMAALIGLAIGGTIGLIVGRWLIDIAAQLTNSFLLGVFSLGIAIGLSWPALRLGPPLVTEQTESVGRRLISAMRILAALLLWALGVAILANLGRELGAWLQTALGCSNLLGGFISSIPLIGNWIVNTLDCFGFIGTFIFVISGLLGLTLALLMSLVAALALASYASRYAQEAVIRLDTSPARLLTAALTGLGVAILIFTVLYLVSWLRAFESMLDLLPGGGLYQRLPADLGGRLIALGIPSLIVGLIAGIVALVFVTPKRPFAIGAVIYGITRTILNTLRAIEPVVLGFVFVAWVGIGPFAGVLALMLNSIADLGKLFSEQVENIDDGPLEAVTATGAGRLQTVVFAVVPQVVPHYIAFIFYRWDINVRLSTIIGFVGGGGIGLILFRSANLTQYRQAAVMVIAIAAVVTALDYISSKLRSRVT